MAFERKRCFFIMDGEVEAFAGATGLDLDQVVGGGGLVCHTQHEVLEWSAGSFQYLSTEK